MHLLRMYIILRSYMAQLASLPDSCLAGQLAHLMFPCLLYLSVCMTHAIHAQLLQAASADQGDKAQENTQAQKQACRPHSGRAGGRPQSNALFNISAHLGLGGAAASRTLSPPKNRPQVRFYNSIRPNCLHMLALSMQCNPLLSGCTWSQGDAWGFPREVQVYGQSEEALSVPE